MQYHHRKSLLIYGVFWCTSLSATPPMPQVKSSAENVSARDFTPTPRATSSTGNASATRDFTSTPQATSNTGNASATRDFTPTPRATSSVGNAPARDIESALQAISSARDSAATTSTTQTAPSTGNASAARDFTPTPQATSNTGNASATRDFTSTHQATSGTGNAPARDIESALQAISSARDSAAATSTTQTAPSTGNAPIHGLSAAPITRIKDVATFEGVRDNQLVGYGLVVGLQGTGDDSNKSPLKESLASMLERLGVKVDSRVTSGLKVKNIAVVMVTATLPPFSRHGARIDVTVSAMGNAKSLLGGVLLPTPLMGADGETYVLAQGSVAVGGYFFGGNAKRQQMQTVIKGVPTNGRISNGGIVEKEISFELAQQNSLRIMLRNPDFTTAKRISDAINKSEKKSVAHAVDPGTIVLDIKGQRNNIVAFLTKIEQLTVRPDQQARIVFDDRDGIIVINENVRIAPIAVAHGSLTIKITEQNTPSSSSYGRSSYGGGYGSSQPSYSTRNTFAFGGGSSTPLGGSPGAGGGTGAQTPSLTGRSTQTSQPLASQWDKPSWSSGAASVSNPVVRNTSIEVAQDDGPLSVLAKEEQLGVLQPSATLQDLVRAINALGCGPRDLIIILQAIKQAGALQAQLEAM